MNRHLSQHDLSLREQERQKNKRIQNTNHFNKGHPIREVRVNVFPTKASLNKSVTDNFPTYHHQSAEELISQLEKIDGKRIRNTCNDETNSLKELSYCEAIEDTINNNRSEIEIDNADFSNENYLVKSTQTDMIFRNDSSVVSYQHDRIIYKRQPYQSKLVNKVIDVRHQKRTKRLENSDRSKSILPTAKMNFLKNSLNEKKIKMAMKQIRSNIWVSYFRKLSKKSLNLKTKIKANSAVNRKEFCPNCKRKNTELWPWGILNEIQFLLFSLSITCACILLIVTLMPTAESIKVLLQNFIVNVISERNQDEDENNKPYYLLKLNELLRTIGYELKVVI